MLSPSPSPIMDSTFSLNMIPVQPSFQHHPVPPSGPQVRSRITVVCAECKRLKLKCDRRTPCGSCTKRDTVQRCVYSPAAAEKIDLHSLNNRLLLVESHLNSIDMPSPLPSPSTARPTDRALFATGPSGSSLAISLRDISSLYLEELGITIGDIAGTSRDSQASGTKVKVEDSADISMSTQLPSPWPFPNSSGGRVTPQLISYLPPLPALDPLESLLKLHPSGVNFRHFRERVAAIKAWLTFEGGAALHAPRTPPRTHEGESAARKSGFVKSLSPPFAEATNDAPSVPARKPTIEEPTMSFYAAAAAGFALAGLVAKERASAQLEEEVEEDEEEEDQDMQTDTELFLAGLLKPCSPSSSSRASGSPWSSTLSPTQLHMLSMQALVAYEQSLGGNKEMYDLDYLVTGIFGIIWCLYGGERGSVRGLHSISGKVYGEVGKMVNVARLMGLCFDPDEAPGRWSLFQAEMRRRVWWEVVYYDAFVSDCMGQPPSISEHTYTTRMPADVDEDAFKTRSVVLPLPGTQSPALESDRPTQEDKWYENGFKYFELKCRLVQLIKIVKGRTYKDGYAIEQAARLEKEVTQFLQALPAPFRMCTDCQQTPPVLLAQRCELAMTANRLILGIYLPFLKAHADVAHQAFFASVNAAHATIEAGRTLHQSANVTQPMLHFYPFGQALFGAAVVCTHAVNAQKGAVWANAALEAARNALEIMRDPKVEGPGSAAVRVVEALIARARGEENGDGMDLGVNELPYVGPAVRASDVKDKRTEAPPTRLDSRHASGPGPVAVDKHGKRIQYPVVGVRVRSQTQTSIMGRVCPIEPSSATSDVPVGRETIAFVTSPITPHVAPSPVTSHASPVTPQEPQAPSPTSHHQQPYARTRAASDLAYHGGSTQAQYTHPPPYSLSNPYESAGTPYVISPGGYYVSGGFTGGFEGACGQMPMEGMVPGVAAYSEQQATPVDVQMPTQMPWNADSGEFWGEEYKFYSS